MSRNDPNERSSRHATIMTAVMLASCLAASAVGCVSSGKYTMLEEERQALSSRNQDLKGELEAARHEREALARETTALAEERAALTQRLDELKAQERALGSKLQEREAEASRLRSTYEGLLASLKKELETGQIQVQQLRDGLRVNVAQEILFDSGSASLDASGEEVLERVAEQLKQNSYQILVMGHTDDRPIGATLIKRYPTNWELAGARAASVVRLFTGAGLENGRMVAVSMADTQPVAPNDTAEGRAKNRRIEIRLRPIPQD